MELGWLDMCLRVSNVSVSREFYEGLGFNKVEGEDEEGWAVVVNGDARIGLYESKHMGESNFSLNFRGGDVIANSDELLAKGYTFMKMPKAHKGGGGSATLLDPDGHTIFFDTAPDETKKI